MKFIFTETELDAVKELLSNAGIGYLEVIKLLGDDFKELTVDDFNLPAFIDFNGPIGYFKTNHICADGSDFEQYELFISEEFIVDIVKIYGAGFTLGLGVLKNMFIQYKLTFKPLLEMFISKWDRVFENYSSKKTKPDDDIDII